MRLNKILVFFIMFISCKSSIQQPSSLANFNHLAHKQKTIIISCIKCECIIKSLSNFFQKTSFDTSIYEVYGDTTCLIDLAGNIRVKHLSQKYIDSCSMDFYNALIISKKDGVFSAKQVSTKEADKIDKFLKY